MSASLSLSARGDAARHPRDVLEIEVEWTLDAPIDMLEARLFWHTVGRGLEDVSLVESQSIESPKPRDKRTFTFTLPEGPYSFTGALTSLQWAVELVAGDTVARWDFVLGPDACEVKLGEGETEIAGASPRARSWTS